MMEDSISRRSDGVHPRVHVVIPHREGVAMLEHCLIHLLSSEGVELEVVVLLNACQDGMPEWAESQERVHEIESEHLGFSAGNNLAAAWASENLGEPDYFLFLNDDTEVAPQAIQHLVEALEKAPEAGIAGPQLRIIGARDHLNSLGLNLTEDAWGWDEGIGIALEDYGDLPAGRSALAVTGSALLMTAEAFEKVAGWTEIYDYYFEDLDLCLKARDLGYDVRLVPEALVYHQISATVVEGSERKLYFFWRNRLMLALIHWPPWLLFRLMRIAIFEEILFRRWDDCELQRRALVGAFRRLPGLLRLRLRFRGKRSWRSSLQPRGTVPPISLPQSIAPWQLREGDDAAGDGRPESGRGGQGSGEREPTLDGASGQEGGELAGEDESGAGSRYLEQVRKAEELQIALGHAETRVWQLEGELTSIHGSKMWRLWLWTIALRRLMILPFRRRWD